MLFVIGCEGDGGNSIRLLAAGETSALYTSERVAKRGVIPSCRIPLQGVINKAHKGVGHSFQYVKGEG